MVEKISNVRFQTTGPEPTGEASERKTPDGAPGSGVRAPGTERGAGGALSPAASGLRGLVHARRRAEADGPFEDRRRVDAGSIPSALRLTVYRTWSLCDPRLMSSGYNADLKEVPIPRSADEARQSGGRPGVRRAESKSGGW